MKRTITVAGAMLAAMLFSATPVLSAGVDLNVSDDGLAIHGYDPVAYFTQNAAVEGSPDITHEIDGAVYRFASADARDAFAANPDKYRPQFGGYCAMGTVMGKKLDIDPQTFRVIDDKLYFNVNKDVQKRWLSDVPGHIAQGTTKWQEISDVPAAELD